MELYVIAIGAFFAAFLTLFSGFGLGTLLMPAFAVFFPVPLAVAMTAFVHLLNSLCKLAMMWRHVNWRITWRFGVPALLAALPGAWLLAGLADSAAIATYTAGGIQAVITPVKLAMGVLLLIFATAEWLPILQHMKPSARMLPLGGCLSGFFGGLSGHQGAFRSAFLLHAGLDKHAFVATNAAIAALVDISRLASYMAMFGVMLSHMDVSLLVAANVMAFFGAVAGVVWLKKVTIRFVQVMVAAALYLLGCLLIAGII